MSEPVKISSDHLASLRRVGQMYLDALNDDPENEALTLPEALAVTDVRNAVDYAGLVLDDLHIQKNKRNEEK